MKLLSTLSILLLFGSVFAVDAINKKVIEPNPSSVKEKTAPGAKQIAEQITKDLKSKVIEKAALADMKVIRKALNIYKLQNGKFPTTKEGITALVKKPKNQKNYRKYVVSPYRNKDCFLIFWFTLKKSGLCFFILVVAPDWT